MPAKTEITAADVVEAIKKGRVRLWVDVESCDQLLSIDDAELDNEEHIVLTAGPEDDGPDEDDEEEG
jgi:hypothetical protein